MTYPGNQALSSDVQKRIFSTFEETLALAAGGSRQEALLGCDFVLRMDPQFDPARRLQKRLGAAMGAVEVDDLRATMRAGSSAIPDATRFDGLDDLAPALPELPDLPEPPGPMPTAPAPAASGDARPAGDLRAELETLLAARRFQELITRAEAERAAVAADGELARLVATAQERLEAGPYVARFLDAARESARKGAAGDAKRLIEKARALDPTHPGLPKAAELAGPPERQQDLPFRLDDQPRAEKPGGARAAASAASAPPAPQGPPHEDGPAENLSPDVVDLSPLRTMAIPAYRGPEPAGGDAESERRIQQLLDEGDKALAAGDPQAAIDAWSRIFLIDIDHEEASRRIEQARRMKAENERQVEEIYHDGLGRLERREIAGARSAFERVLELQPSHLGAREYLQQLANVAPLANVGPAQPPAASPPVPPSGAVSPPVSSVPAQRPPAAPRLRAAGDAAAAPAMPSGLLDAPGAPEVLKEEILVPPDIGVGKGLPRPEPRRVARPAAEGRGKRLFLVVGSVVLLLLAAAGWFVYQNRDQWFPNSQAEEPPAPPPADPIARAKRLHDGGRTGVALAQLRRLPPTDPHYKEAQELIARWEAATPGGPGGTGPGTPPAAGSDVPSGPGTAGAPSGTAASAATPEALARRQDLIAAGQKAYGAGSYILASEKLEQADHLARLDGAAAAAYADAQERLRPLARQLAMVRQHDWEYALPELWRLHEAQPANRDINQMLVDCYYDLGVRDLQRNDPAQAAGEFAEAASLDREDDFLARQLRFAQTYKERPPDLLYRIYVKYLPLR